MAGGTKCPSCGLQNVEGRIDDSICGTCEEAGKLTQRQMRTKYPMGPRKKDIDALGLLGENIADVNRVLAWIRDVMDKEGMRHDLLKEFALQSARLPMLVREAREYEVVRKEAMKNASLEEMRGRMVEWFKAKLPREHQIALVQELNRVLNDDKKTSA